MTKNPGYIPVNRVPRLAGMILIFVYMRRFIQVCRQKYVTWHCFGFSSVFILVTVKASLLSIQLSLFAYQLENLIPQKPFVICEMICNLL